MLSIGRAVGTDEEPHFLTTLLLAVVVLLVVVVSSILLVVIVLEGLVINIERTALDGILELEFNLVLVVVVVVAVVFAVVQAGIDVAPAKLMTSSDGGLETMTSRNTFDVSYYVEPTVQNQQKNDTTHVTY